MVMAAQNMIQDKKVLVKTPDQLTQEERDIWTALRGSNPALYSPYFHIEYTDIIARLRDDVRVIVVYDGDAPIAFLPFQGKSFARPVGAPMTDYHGFIKAPGTQLFAADILKEAGLGVYHFSAMIGRHDDVVFQSEDIGAAIDITGGAQAWRDAQDSSYGRHLKNCKKKGRRSEREHGAVTVDSLSLNRVTFDTMIRWKQEQFASTGKYDVLGAGWTLDLLQQLWERGPDADLRCDMFALRVDGELAAIDMGLSDGKTYHSWMVTYNQKLSHLSPGMQLLECLLDLSADIGYNIIDLGVGIGGYKRSYNGMDVSVGQGFISAGGPAAALSKAYRAAESLTEKAPLGPVSQLPGKLRRRYSQVAACDPSKVGRTKAMLQALKGAPKS